MKKQFLLLVLFSVLVCGSISISSCGSGTKEEPKKEVKGESNDPNAKSGYVCPMGCKDSESMEPGKCKVCGMDLVKNENQ